MNTCMLINSVVIYVIVMTDFDQIFRISVTVVKTSNIGNELCQIIFVDFMQKDNIQEFCQCIWSKAMSNFTWLLKEGWLKVLKSWWFC